MTAPGVPGVRFVVPMTAPGVPGVRFVVPR